MKLKPLFSAIISSLFACQAYAISETTVYQYHYDSNGNTTEIKLVTNNNPQSLYKYSYNDLNQMTGFEDVQNEKSFSYVYYPDGKRLRKHGEGESSQEEIIFYYGHSGQLMNESYSKNNETIKQSSYFAGLRFIDDLIHSNDSHLQYPIADQQNHPATINFTQDATTIESYQLTDYGQLAQSNTEREDKQVTELGLFNFEINPKIYGSGYYDSESNLQYMGARYYSADTQRFMAQDSYNLLNRYNYANGNPVMNYDPDGHNAIANIAKEVFNAAIPSDMSHGVAFGSAMVLDAGFTAMLPSSVPVVLIGALGGYISGGGSALIQSAVSGDRVQANNVLMQASLGAMIGGLTGIIANKARSISNKYYKTLSSEAKSGGNAENLTWEEVCDYGVDLSNGSYGNVYAYKDRVYKMIKGIHMINIRDMAYLKPERAVGYWNQVFNKAYNGNYAEYATARVVNFNGVNVLSTPNMIKYIIPETDLIFRNGKYKPVLSKDLNRLVSENLNRLIGELWKIDEIKINDLHYKNLIAIGDDLLPIDYDLAYRINGGRERSKTIGTIQLNAHGLTR